MKTNFAQLLFASSLLLCSCSSSDDGDSQASVDAGPRADAGLRAIDLLGTWSASVHLFTDSADATETYDRIASGGETRMVVLAGGGTRTFVIQEGEESAYDGTLQVVGDTLRLTTIESPPRFWNWSFSLAGETLTLDEPNQEFDFTLADGAPVPATEHVVFDLK